MVLGDCRAGAFLPPVGVVDGACDEQAVVIIDIVSGGVLLVVEKVLHRGHEVGQLLAAETIGEGLHLDVLVSVHHVDLAGHESHAELAVIGNGPVTSLTGLGGDEDDAVRTLGSIDCRGGGILQNGDGFDVGGVYHVAGNPDRSVYHVERVVAGVDRTITADAETGASAGTSREGGNLYAGHLSCHVLEDIEARGPFGQGLSVNLGDGGSQVLADHGTVTDDHGLVQHVHVFRHYDVEQRPAVQPDDLVLHADH